MVITTEALSRMNQLCERRQLYDCNQIELSVVNLMLLHKSLIKIKLVSKYLIPKCHTLKCAMLPKILLK